MLKIYWSEYCQDYVFSNGSYFWTVDNYPGFDVGGMFKSEVWLFAPEIHLSDLEFITEIE